MHVSNTSLSLVTGKHRAPQPGEAMTALAEAVERCNLDAYITPFDAPLEPDEIEILDLKVDPMDLVAKEVRLKSMPLVVHQLEKLMKLPTTTADDLARVISLDTGLSAQLLRVVNSAMYGFPSKVETISRAVTILGTRRLSMLALGATVVSVYKEELEGLNMRRFWLHNVACAVAARALAVRSGKESGERAFVAGMLHDVGKLCLTSGMPQASKSVMACMQHKGVTASQAEYELLGFDHARLGAILLRKWNFPLPLAKAVLYHHCPWQTTDNACSSVVHVADAVCSTAGIPAECRERDVELDEDTWQSLGLPYRAFDEVLNELERRLGEVSLAFAP